MRRPGRAIVYSRVFPFLTIQIARPNPPPPTIETYYIQHSNTMIEVLVMSVLPVALAMRHESNKDELQGLNLDMSEFQLDNDYQEPEKKRESSSDSTSIEFTLEQSQSFRDPEGW